MSSPSTWRCEECGRTGRGQRHTTILGGTVCTGCHDQEEARTTGLLGTQGVGGAVVLRGAGRWVRRLFGSSSA